MTDSLRTDCYHCGQPVPPGVELRVEIEGESRPMCCTGCQAVAQAIVDNGLTDYYRYRTDRAQTAEDLVPPELRDLSLYDHPELQRSFVHEAGENLREAALILEGITCAACVWLNERHVGSLPGVIDFRINYSTHRARLRWDDSRIHLSQILEAIAAIGYYAHPFDPGRQEEIYKRERGVALRRLAVAGIGAMQVMMLAVALYIGEGDETQTDMMQFMRWVSLVLATPVVFYSGSTFLVSAWRDLRRWHFGMDVPVSLAILSTYFASTWATVTHSGQVYFESVTMFVFFLLAGRFLEMGARQRAGQATEAINRLLPPMATRLFADGDELVSVHDLAPGDLVRIRPGETVPADGVVAEGRSSIDESMLTGESLPRARVVGDPLTGGTLNVESPLIMRVERVGEQTTLSAIQRLLERAQTERPRIARLAEQGTGWFVAAVLLLTAAVGLVWWQWIDADRAFWVVVAMLVATCPCALALATPVAITAATGALMREGLLTTRGDALETLARATDIVFDKTGTLTEGRLSLVGVEVFDGQDADTCQRLAATLETDSEHPVARVLARGAKPVARALDVVASPGHGIEGVVEGARLRIGSPRFVAEFAGLDAGEQARLDAMSAAHPEASLVLLGGERRLLAAFLLADRLREDAAETVAALAARGLRVHLYSGDAPATVAAIARRLGIEAFEGALTPEGKLQRVRALQAGGAVVAMVGDGANDAPVLSQAQVSVAMAEGTQLAHASADMVLYSRRLSPLVTAVTKARATVRIIHQNFAWALGYNGVALPVAATGLLTPWLAALGMSLSSLLVVINALRLGPQMARRERVPAPATDTD
ncbi:MAG TPA: heavy metal translocating P-type ATPase [Thioalkalivibrio sp.]|nr:heavy metal translocating P-type ATPase [Thioalkalivibrio sp.]